MLWPSTNINKPRARLGVFGSAGLALGSCAGCSNRPVRPLAKRGGGTEQQAEVPRCEARHMASAAMACRAARAGRRQPDRSNAAHRRSCAICLAVRLIRATAPKGPKGAKMLAASETTSRCEAQSSRLVPSRTARRRGISSGPLAVGRSPNFGTGAKTTNGVVQSHTGQWWRNGKNAGRQSLFHL